MESEAEEPPVENARALPPPAQESQSPFVGIATCERDVALIGDNGHVYRCWGGQLRFSVGAMRIAPARVPFPDADDKIVQVAFGDSGAFFLSAEGNVYRGGYNGSRQYILSRAAAPPGRIVQVATSGSHTLFLNDRGRVYASGSNYCGQLGLGDKRDRKDPELVSAIPAAAKVFAARSCTIIIDAQGRAHSCGFGEHGQLSLGDRKSRRAPTLVRALVNVKIAQVAIGTFHTVFLTDRGHVYTCGKNNLGQLGFKTSKMWLSPALAFIAEEGAKVTQISAGHAHTLALTDRGDVFGWGHSGSGQLGRPPQIGRSALPPIRLEVDEEIVAAAAWNRHTVLLAKSGAIYFCGWSVHEWAASDECGYGQFRKISCI